MGKWINPETGYGMGAMATLARQQAKSLEDLLAEQKETNRLLAALLARDSQSER